MSGAVGTTRCLSKTKVRSISHVSVSVYLICLLTSNEQQGGIHHSGAVQHSCHKNVVTGAIHKAHVTHQSEATRTGWTRTGHAVILAGAIRYKAGRTWALGIVALVDLGIGIT